MTLPGRWEHLRNHPFARNVTVLAGGTALGQAAVVLSSPLLTRLYDPSEFGMFEFYLGVVGVFSVLANLRFHEAVPLPAEDSEASPLIGLGVASSVVTSLISLLAVLALRNWIAELAGSPSLATALLLVPVAVFVYGVNVTLQGWMVRVGDYTSLAKVNVRQSVAQIVGQILLGLSRLASIGLVLGHAAGNGAGLFTLLTRAKASGLDPRAACRFDAMGKLARRYRHFPMLRGPTTLLQTVSFSAVPVTLTLLFGSTTAGFYALVVRLLGLPLLLVGQSTMRVFYGEASRYVRTGERGLQTLLDKTFRSVFVIVVPAVALGAFASTWLIPVVFGQVWEPSVRFLQIMAPAYAVRICQTTIGGTFSVLGRQRTELGMEVIRVAGTTLALGAAYAFDLTAVQAISLVSLAGVVANTLVVLAARNAAIEFDRDGHAPAGA